MKKNNWKHLVLLLAVFSGTEACKKYDEGPLISLRSKTSRLTGTWQATSYRVNGEEMLYHQMQAYLYCDNGDSLSYTSESRLTEEWTFAEGGALMAVSGQYSKIPDFDRSTKNCTLYEQENHSSRVSQGNWSFEDRKQSLNILLVGTAVYTWEIIRLKEKELKLRTRESGRMQEYTFEKK